MQRKVLALNLINDAGLIAAHEARHAPGAVWPAVVEDIRNRCILGMKVSRARDELVMVAEVADDYPRPADPTLIAAVEQWEAGMDAYQRPIAIGLTKWTVIQRIFALAGQAAP